MVLAGNQTAALEELLALVESMAGLPDELKALPGRFKVNRQQNVGKIML
ncbi:hypothetical protein ABDB91_16640 [Desulfoscipio sp. XC116]